jgi:integrase
VATVLYTGLRISELLGLVWDDVDFAAGVIHVRAQLSRAHRGAPGQRVAPKTPASVRDVPLVAQLARLLNAQVGQVNTHPNAWSSSSGAGASSTGSRVLPSGDCESRRP